jgi:hypothetical protein
VGAIFQPLPASPIRTRWLLRWKRQRGNVPLPLTQRKTFTNNFEGGTNGVTITPANSGGISGDAFTAVPIVAGGTVAFDNAHAAHGTLAAQIATGGTSGTAWAQWRPPPSNPTWFRAYYYFTAFPVGSSEIILKAELVAGAGTICQFSVSTSGKIQAADASFGNIPPFPSVTSIPLNQWFRIEGFIVGDPSVGQVELKLFKAMDSTIPDEVVTSAATVNTRAPVSQINFGTFGANLGPFWMDDIGTSPDGYLGPAAAQPSFVLQLNRIIRRYRISRGSAATPPVAVGVAPVVQPRNRTLRWRRPEQNVVSPPSAPSAITPAVPAPFASRNRVLRWVRHRGNVHQLPGPTTTPSGAVFGPFAPTRVRIRWWRRKSNAAVVPSGGLTITPPILAPPAARTTRTKGVRRVRVPQSIPLEAAQPVTPAQRLRRQVPKRRVVVVQIVPEVPQPIAPQAIPIRRVIPQRRRGPLRFVPPLPRPVTTPVQVWRRLAQRLWHPRRPFRKPVLPVPLSAAIPPPPEIDCTVTVNDYRAWPEVAGYPVTLRLDDARVSNIDDGRPDVTVEVD